MSTEAIPDFRRLAEGLGRLTTGLDRARQELDSMDVHGASPDGLVRAVMRAGRLVALTVDPAALGEQDAVRLGEAVLAAVQDCEQRSAAVLDRHTGPMRTVITQMFDEAGRQ